MDEQTDDKWGDRWMDKKTHLKTDELIGRPTQVDGWMTDGRTENLKDTDDEGMKDRQTFIQTDSQDQIERQMYRKIGLQTDCQKDRQMKEWVIRRMER